ncbi:MAG: hypothetical protein ACR2O6_14035 [Ilumatobacteraceae bacterium]
MSSTLLDVRAAFGEIARLGAITRFRPGTWTLDGGHLQGVGAVDERTLALSASSKAEATVAFVEWADRIGFGTGTSIGHVVVGDRTLHHAGGLQIADDVLAVGVEAGEVRSRVVFLDVADANAPSLIDHLAFERPGPGQAPENKRWTAGAVGLTRRGHGYLLVVGSWDSAQLDFYESTGGASDGGELRDPGCSFRHVSAWDSDGADRTGWKDGNYGAYQSVNLIMSTTGGVFFVAGNRNRSGEDWIDLFSVDLSDPAAPRVAKEDKRHLTCRDDASFRWAGGLVVDGEDLHAIAAEKNLHSLTTVNAFIGGGGLRFVVNRRSGVVHSLLDPCPYVGRMSAANRVPTDDASEGSEWCDYCFPERADG